MSEQEPTQNDDQHTDEQMQDLPVAEEQQDDVTGGAKRGPGRGAAKKSGFGDSAVEN